MSCKKCKESKIVLKDIIEWLDSDPVKGSWSWAGIHGFIVDEKFSKAAKEMFDKARKLIK